ncbi:MAG: hypothetical protein HN617_17560 [Planctomycetaceae bacterium]|nr:hypothetical protein [Planctomycetaceae bacterium]MBT7919344.1 hypothetical protein [Planctomycetaceae bacterium]
MRTLDYILDKRAITIAQLAELSSLDQGRVEAITAGRWTASPHERQQIVEALDLTVKDVIWGHYMEPRVQEYRRVGFKRDFQ